VQIWPIGIGVLIAVIVGFLIWLQSMRRNIVDEEKEYYSVNRRVWRLLAPFYDLIATPISKVRGQVVNFVGAEAGAKVLDVATGTGEQAIAFARHGYDVTGIDLSADMLRVARRKNRYPNLKFVIADATGLLFDSGKFDVTSISFALHDMPVSIREKVLKEMARVTRPGGTIVIVDYALPRNRIGRFFIHSIIRLYEGKTYRDFVKSDLKGLLADVGIQVKEELPVVLGAGRVLKGGTGGAPANLKRSSSQMVDSHRAPSWAAPHEIKAGIVQRL